MDISTEQIQQIMLAHDSQATLLKSWALTGGTSAQTIALEIALPDDTIEEIVLRVHGENDRASNSNIARDEYTLLKILHHAGLPVPKPYTFDASNTILTTPYLLMEFIEGQTQLSPSLSRAQLDNLVNHLLRIHRVNLSDHDLSFLPHQHDIIKHRLYMNSHKNHRITDSLKQVFPRVTMNPPTLVHGDYWLGNILWQGEQLVGIIDWEDAMLGDPLSDLGKSRLELMWIAGQNVTHQYTQLYVEQTPHLDTSYLPFWDLWGALRLAEFANWFEDSVKIKEMQTIYDEFVEQAILKLDVIEE